MTPANDNIKTLSDAGLMELYKKKGDLEILGQLYSRYMPLVYGVSLKYLQDIQMAEDAVMQIFEELIEKLQKHEVREFKTWLYSLTRNHCLGILRRKKSDLIITSDENFVEFQPLVHLLDKRDEEQKLTVLEDCLEKLPDPQKVSVRMFFYDDKSYAEISETTNYNIKSVKSYIQNGKRNLKNCMDSNMGKEWA